MYECRMQILIPISNGKCSRYLYISIFYLFEELGQATGHILMCAHSQLPFFNQPWQCSFALRRILHTLMLIRFLSFKLDVAKSLKVLREEIILAEIQFRNPINFIFKKHENNPPGQSTLFILRIFQVTAHVPLYVTSSSFETTLDYEPRIFGANFLVYYINIL